MIWQRQKRASVVRLIGLCACAGMIGAATFGVIGCEDSAHHAAARPPQIRSAASTPAPPILPALPARPTTVSPIFLSAMPVDGPQRVAKQAGDIFARGQRDSLAGRSELARDEFDQAQEILDASGFDVQADPALLALSAQIKKAIGDEEKKASASTDGTKDEGAEPASPLDEITASTGDVPATPVTPGLEKSAEGELNSVSHDLPLTINEPVLAFLNFFQTNHGRAIVETGLNRAGRYRAMIERILREEGIPTDLMYMAQAESAFQPQALSKAGARGMWQFMSWRGKEYGLDHSWWVDDRQDPEKATRAAAHHLHDLYNTFGDWYLAIAAYDCGDGAVQHAIERTGYADFWQLYKLNVLPKETRNYVPIILALTLIAKDPARYGMNVDPQDPVPMDNVQPGHALDLRLAAQALDVDTETLRSLNPQMLRLVTPSDPSFVLHLPQGTAERFQTAMAAVPMDKWTTWRLHPVQSGESLAEIGRKYGVTSASLMDANNLDSTSVLEHGQKIVIPLSAAQSASGQLVRYRTRRTDTLASIADEFDVTVAELKSWNHLRASKVPAGGRLKIYLGGMETSTQQAKTTSKSTVVAKAQQHKATSTVADNAANGAGVTHRVVAGETLWSIAKAYQTTVDALRSGNQFLFSRPLQAGDMLQIGPAK